jgi:hypothetical protein
MIERHSSVAKIISIRSVPAGFDWPDLIREIERRELSETVERILSCYRLLPDASRLSSSSYCCLAPHASCLFGLPRASRLFGAPAFGEKLSFIK